MELRDGSPSAPGPVQPALQLLERDHDVAPVRRSIWGRGEAQPYDARTLAEATAAALTVLRGSRRRRKAVRPRLLKIQAGHGTLDWSEDWSDPMPREVGAYEAKTRLPELLRQVEQGERITITVRGRPVAELVPAQSRRLSPGQAVAAMKAFAPIKGVSEAELSDWIAEGRR